MKFYIANFSQIRYFDETCIPISTCCFDPKFYHDNKGNNYYYINKNNVLLGIREEQLSPLKIDMSDSCQKDCPHRELIPNCPFLIKYKAYLNTVDFNYIMSEFRRIAEDVQKITGFRGESKIILLVYETEANPCSERHALLDWFLSHGVQIINWNIKN